MTALVRRVVDKNIDPAERLLRLLDHLPAVFCIGEVAGDERRLSACLFNQPLRLVRVVVLGQI